MNIPGNDINEFLNRYILFVDQLSRDYHYEKNIRHLLYIIVPSFVLKYGMMNETAILNCFRETRIYINEKENKVLTAYFARIPKMGQKDGKPFYYTEKFIVLNDYRNASFPNLFDHLIHEFNHAINSIHHEISYDDKVLSLRAGISFLFYDKKTLTLQKKDESILLEEIINTSQTEEMIDLIASLDSSSIENEEFRNALLSLRLEVGSNYRSEAYSLQTYLCQELMKNKTFLSTICELRFKGVVEDIPKWFDSIVGEENTYHKLCTLLNEIFQLEKEYGDTKWFKNQKIKKIRKKMDQVFHIISDFSSKCIFK